MKVRARPSQTEQAENIFLCHLEVEKEKMEAIYPSLYFNNQVVNCDYTEGRFNIVLLMQGNELCRDRADSPSFTSRPWTGCEDQRVSDHHPLRGMIRANLKPCDPRGDCLPGESGTPSPAILEQGPTPFAFPCGAHKGRYNEGRSGLGVRAIR